MLLLTQAAGERVFESLQDGASYGQWRIRRAADEPQTLLAEQDGNWIAVVCGRQVRCEMGLEVVALGTLREFPDGGTLADRIREVQASGALACLPWGFGKWTGTRGKRVRDALGQGDPGSLVVCDNGGRLAAVGQPGLIRQAARLGFKVLPGTDPFPLGDDYRRAGGFGFFAGAPQQEHPWRDLRAWLDTHEGSPSPYGKALGPGRFLVNNIGIQLHNRRKRKEA
jgi:hypothetical protein